MVYHGGTATCQTKSPVHYRPNQIIHLPSVITITASVATIASKHNFVKMLFLRILALIFNKRCLQARIGQAHAAPQQQVSSVSHLLSGRSYTEYTRTHAV